MLRKASAKIRKHRGWDNPTLAQAKKRSDWAKWEEAILREYEQILALAN